MIAITVIIASILRLRSADPLSCQQRRVKAASHRLPVETLGGSCDEDEQSVRRLEFNLRQKLTARRRPYEC
jgi:hypothetical protein